jgi:hypothetical protein
VPTSKTYLSLAEEAQRAAEDAKTALDCEQFLKFAEHWRKLAGEARLGEEREKEIRGPEKPRNAVNS